jgi:hypothetical protein
MNKYRRTAEILIGLGCVVVLVGSRLDEGLRNALRAVFLMIGLTCIVVAVVTLIATFARTQTRKPIILFLWFRSSAPDTDLGWSHGLVRWQPNVCTGGRAYRLRGFFFRGMALCLTGVVRKIDFLISA